MYLQYRKEGGNIGKNKVICEGELNESVISFKEDSKNNLLIIEKGINLHKADIRFLGNNSLVYIAKRTKNTKNFLNLRIDLWSNASFYFGENASIKTKTPFTGIIASDTNVFIGNEAMLSENITIRTTDAHSVYKVEGEELINPNASVLVGDYVWIGANAFISKGTTIGSGSIVGARAGIFGSKTFPSNVSIGGTPAKILNEEVIWTRDEIHDVVNNKYKKITQDEHEQFFFQEDEDTLSFYELDNELIAKQNPYLKEKVLKELSNSRNRFAIKRFEEKQKKYISNTPITNMNEIKIKDIYWTGTYLNLILTEELPQLFLYRTANEEKIPMIKVKPCHFKINIVNVENKDRFLFGKYNFHYNYKDIKLCESLYPQIDECDRHFRYGKDMQYLAFLTFDEETPAINFNFYKKVEKPNPKRIMSDKGKLYKRILFALGKLSMMLLYKVLYPFRRFGKKKVLFLTVNSKELGGNLKALYEYMQKNTDLKLLISTANIFQEKNIFSLLKCIINIGISYYIFVDNYTPIFNFLDLDKDVELVQVWHAGVGFKSVGYARFGKPSGPDIAVSSHRKYTKAIAPTKKLVEIYQDVFGISKDKFIVSGLPRLDGFLEKKDDVRKSFYKKYPNLKNKKILLFAPTFRGGGQESAYYNFDWLDFNKIEEFCKENDCLFLVKMHPFVKEIDIDFNNYKHILNFSDYPDFNELLFITDCLITDFSSNIYEAALLDIPIKFFAPDKDRYQHIRATHRKLEEFEGSNPSSNTMELIDSLHDLEIQDWQKTFKKLEVEISTGNSCKKIVDEVIFNKKSSD